jgi:hypothetical protein
VLTCVKFARRVRERELIHVRTTYAGRSDA